MARVQVPVTTIGPTKASLTTALTGTDNDLVFTAVTGGSGGNSIRVQYIVSGNNTPLSVAVQGWDILVTVATDGGGAATSTASAIMTAIQGNVDASRLVGVALAPSNNGTGIVTALSLTNLAGGKLDTSQPSLVDGDATNGHYITGNDGITTIEVVSSDGSSRTVSIEWSPHYAPYVDIPAEVVTIPAGETKELGPFPLGIFDQNSAKDIYFVPSVSTTLKFRAYRPAR